MDSAFFFPAPPAPPAPPPQDELEYAPWPSLHPGLKIRARDELTNRHGPTAAPASCDLESK